LQAPFGYTRKDVLLIGAGVTAFGVGLKYGLEVRRHAAMSNHYKKLAAFGFQLVQ